MRTLAQPRSSARVVCLSILVALLVATIAPGCSSTAAGDPNSILGPAPLLTHLWHKRLTHEKDIWGPTSTFEFSEGGLLARGVLVIGTRQGVLMAARSGNGEEVWRLTKTEGFEAPPLVTDRALYIGGLDGHMYALDPNSGRERWSFSTGAAIQAPASLSNGVLVFSNEANQVFALDAGNGEFLWRKERKSVHDFTIYGHAGVVVHDDIAYTGFTDGQLMAYALEDGATVWGFDLSAGKERFRDVDTTPLIVRDTLFAASFAGGLYAFDRRSGEVVWHHELEGVTGLTHRDGWLYFSSLLGVHATDPRTGHDQWHLPLRPNALPSQPSLDDRFVYVSLRHRGLMVIQRTSGAVRAIYNPGGGFSAPPTVAPGRVYALSNRGILHAFHLHGLTN